MNHGVYAVVRRTDWQTVPEIADGLPIRPTAADRRILARLAAAAAVLSVTLLPLVSRGGEKPALQAANLGARDLGFSPDGRLLAGAFGEPKTPGKAVVWDVAGRRPVMVHDEPVGIASVAFAPDGKTLAVGIFSPVVKLFDVASGKAVGKFEGHTDAVRAAVFSPDGKALITGSYDRTIKLWDVAARKAQRTLEGHDDKVFSAAVSPSGRWIASASADGSIRVWRTDGGESKQLFPAQPRDTIARHVAFSPDGRWLLSTRWDERVRVHAVETWELRLAIKNGGSRFVRLSPDGRTLAATSHQPRIKLFELDLGDPSPAVRQRIEQLLDQWDDDDYEVREAATRQLREIGLTAEPILRRCVTSPSVEVRIRARRLADEFRSPQAVAELIGHEEDVEPVCFSPDGKILASGDAAGVVRLWDVQTRKSLAIVTADPESAGR